MTATTPPPVAKSPPPPPLKAATPQPTAQPQSASPGRFTVHPATQDAGQRIVIYGTGGIGKSTLAALAPKPIFIDADRGAGSTGAQVVAGVESWSDMRDALHSDVFNGFGSIVIDTLTKVQEWGEEYTLKTVKHEKGHFVNSVEGYGFGKGYQHTYDTLLTLLSDLDAHARAGRNAILVCHQTTDTAPNPEGEDYKRNEPMLQQPPKQGRFRDRVKNWCDHMFYIGYDIAVSKGKAIGAGTRTIYPTEMPTYWAKSRSLRDPIPFPEGSTDLWNSLFSKGGAK